MTMKITVANVVEAMGEPGKHAGPLLRLVSERRFPTAVKWALSLTLDEVENRYRVFDRQRMDILSKYMPEGEAEKARNENRPPELGDKAELANKEYTELLECKVSISGKPVEISDDFGLLTTIELRSLKWCLVYKPANGE